jgi:hypothetical protein
MLLNNRTYTPQLPDRDAQKIYIYCEGAKRETQYFNVFKGIDSRIDIVVYELNDQENNSAEGLVRIAENDLDTKELIEGDEIWIVLDTDTYGNSRRIEKLKAVRQECVDKQWKIAQSNPCFEVWLYYHKETQKPNFENIEAPSEWKKRVGEIIKGGFNSKKHAYFLPTAMVNAETNFALDNNNFPDVSSTEVFQLAKSILAIGKVKLRIEQRLQGLKI